MHQHFVAITFLVALTCSVAAQEKKAAPAPSQEAAPNPIQTALREYVAAFNAHDAAGVAAKWAPEGVYDNKSTGERTVGRAALQADFESLFAESPDVRMTGKLTSVRAIKPEVALAEGTATVFLSDAGPIETSFTVVYVKEGDQWLVDSIHESATPTPESSYDALRDLEWMVGHWVDQTEGARVDTIVRWSRSQAFLVRSFNAELPGQEPMEGTQIIGWDPGARQIRSWTFNSDGSFGEATWSKNDADWMVKSTQVLTDGALAAGTQVITRVDDNTLTVQTIGRTIDGEPAPGMDPVTVVRIAGNEPIPEPQPAPAGAAPAPVGAAPAPAQPVAPPAARPVAPPAVQPAAPPAAPAQPAVPAKKPAAPAKKPGA